MIESILVYGVGSLLMYVFGRIFVINSSVVSFKNRNDNFALVLIFISISLFAFIYGARWNVGVDHMTYVKEYKYYSKFGKFTKDTFEEGFEYITAIFANSGVHFFWYLFFFGMVLISPVYFFARKFSFIYPYVGPVVILSETFLNWSNGMRQNVAACLYLLIWPYLIKRKFIRYSLSVLGLTLIHRSAIFLLVIYFIPFSRFDLSRKSYYLLLGGAIFAGQTFTAVGLFSNINVLALYSGYDFYVDFFDFFIANEEKRSFGFRTSARLLVELVLIWHYPTLKKLYRGLRFDVMFNIYFIGVFFTYLFRNLHHIFLRPLVYFYVFSIIMSCFLLHYLVTRMNRENWMFYLFVILVALSYTLLSCYDELGKGMLDYSNYRFFWNNGSGLQQL